MNNEQLMKLDGLVYLREITSGKYKDVKDFIDYITTDENGNINPDGKINETKIRIAERDYQISTLEAAGKLEEADKIRKDYSGDNVVNFEVDAINNGAMQKTVDMIRDDDELFPEEEITSFFPISIQTKVCLLIFSQKQAAPF